MCANDPARSFLVVVKKNRPTGLAERGWWLAEN
jgi:hypothetical protein